MNESTYRNFLDAKLYPLERISVHPHNALATAAPTSPAFARDRQHGNARKWHAPDIPLEERLQSRTPDLGAWTKIASPVIHLGIRDAIPVVKTPSLRQQENQHEHNTHPHDSTDHQHSTLPYVYPLSSTRHSPVLSDFKHQAHTHQNNLTHFNIGRNRTHRWW